MPVEHELRLMLVNTLRKDLEHEDIPIICLALENVVGSWNEDLVPAIQTDLYDLLSHNSPHIRRRALHAYRSLSVQHKDLLSNIGQKVSSRCKDPVVEVAIAAVALCKYMVECEYPVPHAQEVINDLFITLTNAASYHPNFVCTILSALGSVGLFDTTIPSVLNLIRSSSDRGEYEILLGAFNVIGKVATERLLSAEPKSPVHHIRSLLISHNPNDVYLFLTCLEYLDPVLWAGTSTDIPAVLDGWEVERIMQLLDGPDQLIRKKTLGLLHRVDLNIVSACYSQIMQSIPRGLSIADLNERATRIHEILVVIADQDGEFYAKELLELTSRLEQGSLEGRIVLEVLVEAVLTHSRHSEFCLSYANALSTVLPGGVDFEIGSSTRLLSSLVDSKMVLSQTILVVMAALAVEQCGKLSIRPLDILEGFAARLQNSIRQFVGVFSIEVG
ncbi:hypothetical protein H0H93_007935 [Arthromyces matolae]|nr:hypothetical protein H0H93_007935 [Arthromyces matolae]